MARRETGRYEETTASGEPVRAFVPYGLPPSDPPIALEGALEERLSAAERALGRLELAGDLVPSLDWFIYAFMRTEAVLSSQIEGTQATLMDLLSYEAENGSAVRPPNADVEEVCNYLEALTFAREQIASEKGLPLSMRLLGEAHAILLRGARGAQRMPGQMRRSQNWIGGSRPGNAMFVPPPPHLLPDLLTDFEGYIHAENGLPPLIRAGLLHVQFETIHPYLDGNGRLGRLLVTLLLEHWRLLNRPLLYLSLFFKRHRQEYYRRLNAVRSDGDWEGWLDFFLDGVATIADEAVEAARDLFTIVDDDRRRLLAGSDVNLLAVQVFEKLPSRPMVSIPWVVEALQTSQPRASRAVEALVRAGVLVETTGRKRDRIYAYDAYVKRLKAGSEAEEEG